jgi:hypothetical protein
MIDDAVVLENEVRLYPRRSLRRGRPLTALVLLVFSVVFFLVPTAGPSPRVAAVIPILVVLVIYLAYRLPQWLNPKPILVVDPAGLTDHTTWAGMGFVDWKEISTAHVFRKARMDGLALVPHDPAVFAARRPWYLRMAFQMNGWFGFPDFFVPCVSLSVPPEKVLEWVEQYRKGKS